MSEHDAERDAAAAPPDLGEVAERIHEARDAEDELLHAMPNAIQPDDDAYEGMSGATEGDVAEADPAAETDDERQAEAPRAVTEDIQDDLVESAAGREDDDEEASVEARVVGDDSTPPADPDHR